MKKFITSLFVIASNYIYAQPSSTNGWFLPPNNEIRVLIVFVEINFDGGGLSSVSNFWGQGNLAPNPNQYFDPVFSAGNNTGLMTKFFETFSFDNYRVTGSYFQDIITVQATNLNSVTQQNVVENAVQQINTLNIPHTNLTINDFDLTERNPSTGVASSLTPNSEFDCVIFAIGT
jgi:hypothetical protein